MGVVPATRGLTLWVVVIVISTLLPVGECVPPTFTPTPTPTTSTSTSATYTTVPTHTVSPTVTRTTTFSSTPIPTHTPTRTRTLSVTPTPTPTGTLTPFPSLTSTGTTSLTHTNMPTHSPTPSPTMIPTRTADVTGSLTATNTGSPTVTDTVLPTRTLTTTGTLTVSHSGTVTATHTTVPTTTPTSSDSQTTTSSRTTTSTTTSTSTRTELPTGTSTPTTTTTPTDSATYLPTYTGTQTPTPSPTPTTTPSATPSSTSTTTRTSVPTYTETSTATSTHTATTTHFPTRTVTASSSPSPTPTQTPIPTHTSTVTLTPTTTSSPTPTNTRTTLPTRTPTPTQTLFPTRTATPSVTSSPTPTITPTGSFTHTQTTTHLPTRTSTPTSTLTHIPTRTATVSVTRTWSTTPSTSGTATVTPSETATATPSETQTATPTHTSTRTATATATVTGSRTFTGTPTQTQTSTATLFPTRTATASRTLTATPSATPSQTATDTPTPTQTASRTHTSTTTSTPTQSQTRTSTRTQTPTTTRTQTATSTPSQTPTASATPSQLRVVEYYPGFGEELPAVTYKTLRPIPGKFEFDRPIRTGGLGAMVRVTAVRPGLPDVQVGIPLTDKTVKIDDRTLYVELPTIYGAKYHVALDEDLVREADITSSAYFLGTHHAVIVFHTTGYPTESTAEFTVATGLDIDDWSMESFCKALRSIILSVPCDQIDVLRHDGGSTIIAWKFVRMTQGSGTRIVQDMKDSVTSGALALALEWNGLGRMVAGSFLVDDGAPAAVTSLDVRLTPDVEGNPTVVTFTATLTRGLAVGGIIHLLLPRDFLVAPVHLVQAQVGNASSSMQDALVKTYSGAIALTKTGSTLIIDTGSSPFPRPWMAGDTLSVSLVSGVTMPPTCVSVMEWIWGLMTYAGGELQEYIVTHAKTDSCTAVVKAVGIPDSSEVVTQSKWVWYSPSTAIVDSSIVLYLTGFRVTGSEPLMLKVSARPDSSCQGFAPGTKDTAVDPYTHTAKVKIDDEGIYDVCIRHRTNWEVLPIRLVVRGKAELSTATPFYGYMSCEELLDEMDDWCGCFVSHPTSGLLPFQLPTGASSVAVLGSPSTVHQGCCLDSDNHRQSYAVTGDSVGRMWGLCTE